MTTLQAVELGVLGPLQVRRNGAPVAIPGAKPRAILTMLGLHGGSVVSANTLIELLWGEDPPRTAAKALQTHISALRRTLGDGVVLTEGSGWTLAGAAADASRYKAAARLGRDAVAAGDTTQAVIRFDEALALWRGIPELPAGQRGSSEKTRWIEAHAALVEDRADALLATGRAAEIIGELEAAVADAPLRERRWGQLMLALYRAGRQGEALAAYQRARSLLADELGVDPGPELRRLEAAVVAQDAALDMPVAQQVSSITRAVTFLLTDIEGSTAAWEADADAMAAALARHDELVEQVVTSRGGRLVKTRGEGDATFSVFERPSAAAAAAIELQDAIAHEPWSLSEPMRIRVALHTGEVELRDGDYFGRAVNRAARLRSLAVGGQILCSGATAELVIDCLPDDVQLADLGMRQLRNLPRPEHVFELRLETIDDRPQAVPVDEPLKRPELPAVLTGPGPFVGRGRELALLLSAWQSALAGGTGAVLIAGEPGVGKTRLAGEWSQQAYEQGAVVLYGRCDEDLGAPYQPFAEALRSLVPGVGAERLRGLRGIEALLPLVPGLADVVPDIAAPARADPDTERYALFDAVVELLEIASATAPVVLILDDLHWAAKPTLLLLRHLLRFGERGRVQIVGTYRSTDLDRSHPLAAMLADLHRDGTADRLSLSGLDVDDVSAYVAEAGYDDEELALALASVTGGNPFFLIEALRHVDESGGVWNQSTLPQGVREAVSRRLSRLPVETNKALAVAAVVGSRFAVELVERIVDQDLVDAFDEACKAGIVIEEPGGHYRFNHALIRQSLLAELPSVRRMRLHQRIATTLESEPGADDELLADLAHHYFECAWAGNAAKAVEYCRRAADQAMARLAYEGAADLYDHALHAMEELDEELPDRDEQTAELLVARCEALLAAGDMASAVGAVAQLQEATRDSARLAAWATCFDGQMSMLTHPERLDEIEAAVRGAAAKLAELDDAAGEAKAHTVRAGCLARLGRIGDCEVALDHALTAARRAHEHRRVNAVLAGAPLAALWGPNPVPRAGGRCLDVVRLLRITTDSPAVEATSTRCQAVLEAFRGRAAAARRMIESARRTVTELGLRHALLEVEQFAGIVELVIGDPTAAETSLRKAYNGFRRMGLDADTAETAALLGRACLELGWDAESDELCAESEALAGHALKAAIAWRTLRAQLLSRRGDHDEARRVAEAAVRVAERTDELVDHGDACLALATVLNAAGDVAGARAAAEQAVGLYERKGAAALVQKARGILGATVSAPVSAVAAEPPGVEMDNACVQALRRGENVLERNAWDEFDDLFATDLVIESRRKLVRFTQSDLPLGDYPRNSRRLFENDGMHLTFEALAVRGERLALTRLKLGTADMSPGAPHDEFLHLFGIDEDGRIALQISFDLEDIDAAMAELDAAHARFEEPQPQQRRLENAASRVVEHYLGHFATRDWDVMAEALAVDLWADDRRRVVNTGVRGGRADEIKNVQVIAELGCIDISHTPIATRGERLVLSRHTFTVEDQLAPIHNEMIDVVEINDDNRIAVHVVFDADDIDAAFEELDARYLAGEAEHFADIWSLVVQTFDVLNKRQLDALPAMTPGYHIVDRRLGATVETGDLTALFRATWDTTPEIYIYVESVHRLDGLGAVITQAADATSREGFDAQWRIVQVLTVDDEMLSKCELFEEAELDNALARFAELHPHERRLENAASRVYKHFLAHFASHEWDSMAQFLADNSSTDDRRRVVNTGIRRGRDVEIADMRALAELGVNDMTAEALAIRGERLVLCRIDSSAFQTQVLNIVEIDADNRIAAVVGLDLDDIKAAFEELDARYLAGEAAAHANTWSLIAHAYTALNSRELAEFPPLAPGYQVIDHRLRATIQAVDVTALFRATWDQMPDLYMYIEAVNRLDDFGAVITQATYGTSEEGFDAQWRMVQVLTVEDGMGKDCEVFDEADLNKALARFDELHPHDRRLHNAATRVGERFWRYFGARDWEAIADILAEDIATVDCRKTANAGTRRGRQSEIEDLRAAADVGFTTLTQSVIAIRGERLFLTRTLALGGDSEAIRIEVLHIIEIDADERITALVVFDVDDVDAAFTELDARYLAGEASAHARAWSLVTEVHAAFNRHELHAITPDYVDHRSLEKLDLDDPTAKIRTTWESMPDLRIYIEAVHRLSDFGAVVTQAAHGATRAGFEAEWRLIELETMDGDRVTRAEIFDESDLDEALARFDQLCTQEQRLQNAATRWLARYLPNFAARDWDTMAEMLTDDICTDDRRRVVNAGVAHGRDLEMASVRAIADAGVESITSTTVATRGERLVLHRVRFFVPNWPEELNHEILEVLEITAGGRGAVHVVFDPDDFDAAFEELDLRYLAGEAGAYAHTWSTITQANTAFNRRELPAITPDFLDHRPLVTIEPGDPTAKIREMWEFTPDLRIYIETVHRLDDLGAVFTQASYGTSQAGFEAEWRVVELEMIEADRVSHAEVFDDAALDEALARFEQLGRPMRRLDNAASQMYERFKACFAARDWKAVGEFLADDIVTDDRRRVVNAGIRVGRAAVLAEVSSFVEIGTHAISSDVIATRGARLILNRSETLDENRRPHEFDTRVLDIIEIDADERIIARVVFDAGDIDAAIAELDARYLAGEAAAYARTWSVVLRAQAALDHRQELPPTTPHWVNLDHRRGIGFAPGDMTAYLRALWDNERDIGSLRARIEAVHRLNEAGAVFVQVLRGSSTDGFDAEWRLVELMTVEGELISRAEIFDEADLDAALATFDELCRPAPRLDNKANQVYARFWNCFEARDWAAAAEMLASEHCSDDRRRVVGAGIRHGPDALLDDMRAAAAEFGNLKAQAVVIATRGDRLVLRRVRITGTDRRPEANRSDVLNIVEIDAEDRITALVWMDCDKLDAALSELDARYLTGEAAAHARIWSLICQGFDALNRREVPAVTDDFVNIDHRRIATIGPGNLIEDIRAIFDLPDLNVYVESVHRLTDLGAVVSHVATGTTSEGFVAEWRVTIIVTLDGDLVSRCELFDESDLAAALATFDKLRLPAPALENAAIRNRTRIAAAFNCRDLTEFVALHDAHGRYEDRRKGLRNEGPVDTELAHGILFEAPADWRLDIHPVAVRGDRLALTLDKFRETDEGHQLIAVEVLCVTEVTDEELTRRAVFFDSEDIDAAFAELDARYVAGEACPHVQTWTAVAKGYAALNRHELPPTTPDWVSIDHRLGPSFAPGEFVEYTHAAFDLARDVSIYIEAVHRLTATGAVVSHLAQGTSRDGFAAEWSEIALLLFDGERATRCELFDGTDLQGALARFDELSQPVRQLRNAATETMERFQECFAARDWHAMAETLAEDVLAADRRPVMGAGARDGRNVNIGDWQAVAEVGFTDIASTVIATRGDHLVLGRFVISTDNRRPEAFHNHVLGIVETNADNRVTACIMFDLVEIDAAFEELDARYIAGEAAPYANTWSIISNARATFQHGESTATTQDWVHVDHRLVHASLDDAESRSAYVHAAWNITPTIRTQIAAVHRISSSGAVITHVAHGTSQDGFDAEWDDVILLMHDGTLIERCELFNEADLDAALARFDELGSPTSDVDEEPGREVSGGAG